MIYWPLSFYFTYVDHINFYCFEWPKTALKPESAKAIWRKAMKFHSIEMQSSSNNKHILKEEILELGIKFT